MQQEQHGRTVWDFISGGKANSVISWICITIAVIFIVQFLLSLTFGLRFNVSFKEMSYSISTDKATQQILDPNITRIDSLIKNKYLPLVNDIYHKASIKPGDENEKIRNEYVIQSTRLMMLLTLKDKIEKGYKTDSITLIIEKIERP